jgi:hypothetical protein
MKQLTYKITQGYSESVVERTEVTGTFLFDLFGYQWAAHKEVVSEVDGSFENWTVSEVSTGYSIKSGKIFFEIEEAKEWAWSYLIKKGEILTRYYVEHARMKLQEYEAI